MKTRPSDTLKIPIHGDKGELKASLYKVSKKNYNKTSA